MKFMTTKELKKIGSRYMGQKTTGWELDLATGAVIVYGIEAIFYNGEYYSMATGNRMRISKENYIKDIRNNMYECHRHDAIEGTGTGIVVHRMHEGNLEFLLQLRSDVNQYGLLGGGLELGETYQICATRELEQEAALTVNEDELKLQNAYAGPKHITRYTSGDLVFHTVIVYSVDYKKCTHLDRELDQETKSLIWITHQELKRLLQEETNRFFPNNYPILWDVVTKFFP